MLFEIKARFGGYVLFSLECGSLKVCVEAAVKSGADLRGAYLRGACLRGAYLRGAYLRGACLRGADLRGAYLRGADLGGADLRGADLGGADLGGACLGGAYLGGACLGEPGKTKIEWTSHQLVSEILFRAAGRDVEKRMVAGLIRISTDWCWENFKAIEHPQKQWAIDELSKWVTDDDGAPELLKKKVEAVV